MNLDRLKLALIRTRVRLHLALTRIRYWLYQHEPMLCTRCGCLTIRKHTHTVRHFFAGWVLLCRDCYTNLYQPSQTKGH